ncbi:MAG: BspA family leucine-rich repeat surface protein [Collinsella sp.]
MVLIAGPWVSSAIRNQFNLVAGAIGSGTTGENFYEPEDIPDPANGTAFAVYSADDHSLMFYKRRGVPQVGDMFNCRRVTAMYTGFENESYGLVGYDPTLNNWDTCDTNVPWYEMRTRVTKVTVVDRGIKPHSLAQYFQRFENLESADLGNFDLSETVSLHGLFLLCSSLRSANVPSISSACTNFRAAFAFCPKLKGLHFNGCDFSGVNDFYHTFINSGSLSFDCSDWNVPVSANHGGFNCNAPGVILPKAWQ